MKKIILFLLFFCGLLLGEVFAHPASDVKVSFEGKVLQVIIVHNVRDHDSHFIDRITVYLNNKEIINQQCFFQTGNEQKMMYVIPSLKEGDLIIVETSCNKGGKRRGLKSIK